MREIMNVVASKPPSPLAEAAPPRIGQTITDSVKNAAEAEGFSTRKVWYHGTNRRFRLFRAQGNFGELGHGIYLTGSKRAANSWAGQGNYVLACFLKDGPIFDSTRRLDPEVKAEVHRRQTDFLKATWGNDSEGYDADMFEDWYARLWEHGDVNETLRKLGYMGAVNHTSQIEDQIVIFDPHDIFIAARMPGW